MSSGHAAARNRLPLAGLALPSEQGHAGLKTGNFILGSVCKTPTVRDCLEVARMYDFPLITVRPDFPWLRVSFLHDPIPLPNGLSASELLPQRREGFPRALGEVSARARGGSVCPPLLPSGPRLPLSKAVSVPAASEAPRLQSHRQWCPVDVWRGTEGVSAPDIQPRRGLRAGSSGFKIKYSRQTQRGQDLLL